jgi:ABC-type sugar transport system substrate-binding protein
MSVQLAQMLLSEDGILLGTTGQAPYELGYLTLNTAVDALQGKPVEPVVYSPAIYFGREDPAKVQKFLDTQGQTFFTPQATGYKMAGITFYSDFFMQTVIAGMQKAAEEQGVEFTNAVSEFDLDKEAQIIEDLVTKGVDAILITPVAADGSIAALKKAKEAGVTIICFNTCVNEEGIASAFLYTEGKNHGAQTGKALAAYVKEKMGGQAKLGILNCEVYELCVERYQGFMAELEGLDVEVVANQQGFEAASAVTVAEAMLQAHPEINLMWSENEGGTVGIVQAVKTQGLDIPVFGLDMSVQLAQMLLSEDGILLGTTGQAPYELGYLTLNTAVDVLQGKPVEPVVYSPAIYFGREDPAKVQAFLDTQGQTFFK